MISSRARSVRITVPARQTPPAQVAQAVVVQGTVQDLGAGQEIWVLTQNPGSSRLNPQPQAAVRRGRPGGGRT